MALQFSTAVRNARADVTESTIGTAPKLRLLSGSAPANCAATQTGTLLAELTLPSDWLSAASGGVKSLSGSWTGTATNAGTVGYFRILDSGATTCHMQGTVTTSGGGGDMIASSTTVGVGDTETITSFTLTEGNA
jgi:hypothetical protein